jgi:hypothetical protein
MSRYPFLKFITEKELERICEDYNLVMASVSRYTKDVPTKNLNEISNAQPLDYQDVPMNRRMIKTSFVTETDASKKYRLIANNGVEMLDSDENKNINAIMKERHGADGDVTRFPFSESRKYSISLEGLFICAPKSHFNLEGTRNKGRGFFDFSEEPKDPIVFRYVKGGIQVLSKWGLEADDYRLNQPILN